MCPNKKRRRRRRRFDLVAANKTALHMKNWVINFCSNATLELSLMMAFSGRVSVTQKSKITFLLSQLTACIYKMNAQILSWFWFAWIVAQL